MVYYSKCLCREPSRPSVVWRYKIQVVDEAVVLRYNETCKTKMRMEPTGVREKETLPHVWKEQGTNGKKRLFYLEKAFGG